MSARDRQLTDRRSGNQITWRPNCSHYIRNRLCAVEVSRRSDYVAVAIYGEVGDISRSTRYVTSDKGDKERERQGEGEIRKIPPVLPLPHSPAPPLSITE
jgi:hypothetical protein